METVKCYGRKKTLWIKKEKSFIRDFFDGDKSSELLLFDERVDNQQLQGRQLFCEQDKENTATNVLQSPILFENSYYVDLSEKSFTLEQAKCKKKKCVKNHCISKKKVKRNTRKNRNNSKIYHDVQPRWSEFNKYNFTVEQLGRKQQHPDTLQPLSSNRFSFCGKYEENANPRSTAQDAEKTQKKTSSNSALIDFHNPLSTVRSPILDNFLASRAENFYSSGELFTKSWYEKCTKKRKAPKNTYKDAQRFDRIRISNQMCTRNFEKKLQKSLSLQEITNNNLDLCSKSESLLSSVQVQNTNSDLFAIENKQEMEKHEKVSKSKCTASDVSDMFCSSNFIGSESLAKIVTSTPVVKIKRSPTIDLLSIMSSSSCKKTTPNCSAIYSINILNLKSDKSDKMIAVESKIENVEDSNILVLKDLAMPDVSKSLQQDFSPLCCSKKSFTNENKLSYPEHSEKSRSLENKSTLSFSLLTQSMEHSDELGKKKLLQLCNQESVIPFVDAYDWSNFRIRKIGEGTFGEVFTISRGKLSSVIKIIPMSEETGDGSYQCLKNVLAEVKISKCLSDLRNNKYNQTKNFIKLNRASVVSGLYPSDLISAWDDFSKAKCSYNDRPDIYDVKQLFVILELEYGGKDLSCFVLRNAVEAESVLKQIAVALAVAEEEFLFEHRDLHLGNILIRRNRSKYITFKLRGHDITIESHGLHATIIDFTLSRLHENGYIYYNDLANDISLFDQSGDFQYEVYRCMKKKLENQWHECSLYSNVLWLSYMCVKLKECDYSRPSTVAHKKSLKVIALFKDLLSHCNCALDCLKICEISKINFEMYPKRAFKSSKNSILVSRNSSQKSKLSIM